MRNQVHPAVTEMAIIDETLVVVPKEHIHVVRHPLSHQILHPSMGKVCQDQIRDHLKLTLSGVDGE